VQTLDLEDLAQHRGSLLGALPGRPQPSQKMFESRLLAAMERLDPDRPTLVEAEASKIGQRMVPPALWRLMTAAPRISLQVPHAARARYLAGVYADSVGDLDALEALLARLPGRHGRKTVAAWRDLAEAGELETLAAALIEVHYDPAYGRVAALDPRPRLGVVPLEGLSNAEQEAAADRIAGMLRKLV
jgi:tRNA 2-selenouridine synthase